MKKVALTIPIVLLLLAVFYLGVQAASNGLPIIPEPPKIASDAMQEPNTLFLPLLFGNVNFGDGRPPIDATPTPGPSPTPIPVPPEVIPPWPGPLPTPIKPVGDPSEKFLHILDTMGVVDNGDGHFTIYGEVANTGKQPRCNVELLAKFYLNGILIQTGTFTTDLDAILPGSAAPFHYVTPYLMYFDSWSVEIAKKGNACPKPQYFMTVPEQILENGTLHGMVYNNMSGQVLVDGQVALSLRNDQGHMVYVGTVDVGTVKVGALRSFSMPLSVADAGSNTVMVMAQGEEK